MGAFQSCLNAKCRNLMGGSSNGGGGNNALEAGDGGEPKKKEYSWDKKRREVDLSKFTIENVAAGEVGRMPGEINGKSYLNPSNLSRSPFLYSAPLGIYLHHFHLFFPARSFSAKVLFLSRAHVRRAYCT